MTWSGQNTLMSLHLKQTQVIFSEAQPEGLSREAKGNRIILPSRLVRSFLEYSATVWHLRQKYNSDKLEMVQRRAARFMKVRYGMFESVTQMLEQLTWIPLSKRRENSRLLYKIINNLAVVPHSCLEKADVRIRKKTFSKVPPHRLQR